MDISVSVPDSSESHAKLLAAFVAAGKQAVADGWQPGQDIPVLLTASVADLLPFFQDIEQLKLDWKSDPFGAILALAVEIKKIL